MIQQLLFDAVGFLGAGLLLWLITKRAGTVLTLAHLFSLPWGPCILAAQFYTTSSGALEPETLAVIFGAWWALLAGFLIVIRTPPAIISVASIGKRSTIALILVLLGLQAAVAIYELPDISLAELPTRALIVTLRDNALRQDENPDVIDPNTKVPPYLEVFRDSYFVYLPLALMLRRRKWISRWVLCILVAAACALALAHMTRAPLLEIIAVLWTSWALLFRPPPSRAWAAAGAAIMAFGLVFIEVQGTLQSGTRAESDKTVNLVQSYYGGSMRAFETILDGTYPREDGYYSADMFNYVMKKVGMVDSYPSLVRPYAPNDTNIYTFLDAYTLDGGIFGAFLGAVLTGMAAGWLFNKASRRYSPFIVISYSLFALCLVMAVANNEFIRISPVITIGLAGIVDLIVVRRQAAGGLSFAASQVEASRKIARGTSPEPRPESAISRA